jgi:hypothetical protein
MRRARLVALLAGFGLALASLPAPAQETEGPCAKDVQRLCPDLKPGRQLGKCFQEKRDQLSPECKARIEERENRRRTFQESCAADVRTFCTNVEGGHGRVRRCLLDHQANISPECRSAVQQIPEAPGAP